MKLVNYCVKVANLGNILFASLLRQYGVVAVASCQIRDKAHKMEVFVMATTVVKGELYERLDGKLVEIKRQIRQPNGYPFDPEKLDGFLQRGVEGKFEAEVSGLPYANERVPSNFGYPQGFRYRTPVEQLEYWRAQKLTRKLDGAHVLDLTKRIEDCGLPAGMESIAVWPKYSRLGGLYKATGQIFKLIAASRSFNNYRGDEVLKKEHWRHTIQTAGCFQRLDEYQPGDYFVVPAQLGKSWAGTSIRHGQTRYAPTEFGLCPYSGGCSFLTHPDRITGDGQLYMDLGGCEWAPYAGGDFYDSAYFFWGDGRLYFDYYGVVYAYANYGGASACVPQ